MPPSPQEIHSYQHLGTYNKKPFLPDAAAAVQSGRGGLFCLPLQHRIM